jgi:hypothetical protein
MNDIDKIAKVFDIDIWFQFLHNLNFFKKRGGSLL